MENKANNITVGLFTLLFLFVGFFLVYWIGGRDSKGAAKNYKVVFTGSITGLARGSNVYFNGVRVGEVSQVFLVPNDPTRVSAVIAVEPATPVKPDTKAQLEYIGLTGVGAVQLTGGSAGSPNLEELKHDGLPVIYAEKSNFQDLIEAGRTIATRADTILSKFENLLGDNEASLKKTLNNFEQFSEALGKNSGSVETLLKESAQLGGKLNTLADRLNTLIGDAGNFTDSPDGKGLLAELTGAAKAVRLLAERLDARTANIASGVERFSNHGLKDYEALASEGRKTLTDINRVLRRLENDPSQIIFGRKDGVREYKPR